MRISSMILALALGYSAHAGEVVNLKAGVKQDTVQKAPPVSMPSMEVIGASDGPNGSVILEISACERTFKFMIPKAKVKDEAVYDAILDYIKRECSK